MIEKNKQKKARVNNKNMNSNTKKSLDNYKDLKADRLIMTT